MSELPPFVDARNVRRLVVEYGLLNWSQEETDRLLEWLGFEPTATAPRTPPRRPRADVRVYIVAEDRVGSALVKIGVSKDPEGRLKTLMRERGAPLYLAHASIGYTRPEAMLIERIAHQGLADWSVGREWFRCGRSIARDVVGECGAEWDARFEDVL